MNIGFLFSIGAAVAWGLTYALDQRILRTFSPSLLLFLNSLFATILTLPLAFRERAALASSLSYGAKQWAVVACAIALAALGNLLIFSGVQRLSASTASVIEIAYPMFVVLFSFLLYRTVPNAWFFAGAALIFLGSAIVIRFA